MAKFNVNQMVTDRMIAMLDKGIIPWRRPWTVDTMAVSRVTGKPYSLLNQILLSDKGKISNGEFATFKQIQAEGGKINKGAKSKQVVFWTQLLIKEKDDDGNDVERKVPFLKYYNVFDINDTDLEPKHKREHKTIAEPDAEAEKVLSNYWGTEGITVDIRQSNEAYYSPALDKIVLPQITQYAETAEYYSTAFHESVHSTGHKSRLDRLSGMACFGNEDYSKEELVAEIGAAALVSMMGLETPKSFRNSTAYVQGWRNAIAKDNKLIVSAAGRAEKAIERIMNPVAPK